jgi:hypothetical protein
VKRWHSPTCCAATAASCGQPWCAPKNMVAHSACAEWSRGRLTIVSCARHVAVVDFSDSRRACSHLVVVHVGEVAPSARREHRPITAQHPRAKGHRGGIDGQLQQHPHAIAHHRTMSSPLLDVWEAAAGSPYHPGVGKNTQFTVGFGLLLFCMCPWCWSYRGALLMPRSPHPQHHLRPQYARRPLSSLRLRTHSTTDRSFANLPLIGVPASVAFGYVFTPVHQSQF